MASHGAVRPGMQWCGLALGVWLVTACGSSPPSRFYLLTPVEVQEAAAPSPVHVRLGPVELPRYLATPEIVTRVQSNELELASFDRWAEPLQSCFERVLSRNLVLLIPAQQVTSAKWQGTGPSTHDVSVMVQRFDVEDGRAVLEAAWSVSSPEAGGVSRRSRHVREVSGGEYVDVVAALSGTLADLSEEIAAAIRGPGAAPSG